MSPAPVFTPATARKISLSDRRATRRYPIGLDLSYVVRRGRQIVLTGVARTCDISSSGVSFRPAHALPQGASVELSLDWPYLLQDSCPLQLIIEGRVVRSDQQATAVKTVHYEFRTRGLRSFRHPISGHESRTNLA